MLMNKKLSIKTLSLLIFLILYLFYFIISLINFLIFNSSEYKKTESIITNYNESFSQQISEKLDNVLNTSKSPMLIPDIEQLNKILTSNNPLSIDDYNYLRYICHMLIIQNESINGAFIYKLNGEGLYCVRNFENSNLKSPVSQEWFKDLLSSTSFTSVIPRISYSDLFSITNSDDEKFIGIARTIVDMNTQNTTGIILLTFSYSDIQELLNHNLTFSGQYLSIYDSNNTLILSTNPDESNYIINPDFDNCGFKALMTYTAINKTKYLTAYNKIQNSNWKLINYIPKSEVYMINTAYFSSFLINLLFGFVLFVVIYLFFIKRLFNPINSLIDNMNLNNIEKNLNYNFHYDKDDEIGILINSYNSMKLKINDLINVNYKNKIAQKELELKQLQQQINPHFIYNTLESIRMMAEINDDEETSIMAEYFGTIIRYSMNRQINTVLLKEEIEIINNYIYLQDIRFEQMFTIKNMISSDVLDCEIIKMIIQPLIENCIYHGLSECDHDGKIIIQGEKRNGNLILTISDNGIGIEKDRLKDLNDYINSKNTKFTGIALMNVNKRIKLYYGDKYGLNIYSVYGKGTSLELTLPYISKNK